MRILHLLPVALSLPFFLAACATTPGEPKLDRSSNLNLSSIAKQYGVPRCNASVPLTQEQVLNLANRYGNPHAEASAEWASIVETTKPGDQLREVTCLTKGKNGRASGDIFYGLFRDGTMVAEMHPIVIN